MFHCLKSAGWESGYLLKHGVDGHIQPEAPKEDARNLWKCPDKGIRKKKVPSNQNSHTGDGPTHGFVTPELLMRAGSEGSGNWKGGLRPVDRDLNLDKVWDCR